MSIIVETGSGVTNANSYVSLVDADNFHVDRKTVGWKDATTTTRIASLIRATDYIETYYSISGTPLTDTQGLSNPLDGENSLRKQIVRGTIVLAGIMLTEDAVDPTVSEESKELTGIGKMTIKRDLSLDPYPMVTAILAPIAGLKRANGYTITKFAK